MMQAETFALARQPFLERRLSDRQALHELAANEFGRLLQRILVFGTGQGLQRLGVDPRRSGTQVTVSLVAMIDCWAGSAIAPRSSESVWRRLARA